MGKDMIIKLLESQLEESNATISQLRLTVDTLNNTISDLRATIVNLESLLTERDESLNKANSQVRGMSKLLEKKSEKQSSTPVAPKTEEEIAQKVAERKARGNNGAKRNMHFEMETVKHDVYPDGMEGWMPFSTRETIRYEMIPPRFIKHLYCIHTVKDGDRLVSAKAHLGLAYFFYDDGSRSEEVILKELEGYSGAIQSDGLGAYKKVAALSGGKILRLACLQYCKREFLDMKGNADADKILTLANQLYQNEHKHKIGEDGWTVEDNLKWRQEYAPQILEQMKAILLKIKSQHRKYPPKSQMYKASNYMLNEWDGIEAIPTGGDYSSCFPQWDTQFSSARR